MDDFDWSINRGPTTSPYTGPYRDHTTSTSLGAYAYIETSSPRINGEKAWLVSPNIQSTSSSQDCQVCI